MWALVHRLLEDIPIQSARANTVSGLALHDSVILTLCNLLATNGRGGPAAEIVGLVFGASLGRRRTVWLELLASAVREV